MGFFSYVTSDTHESIPITQACDKPAMTVWLKMPDGQVFKEADYEGYGVFGGMDIFDALAQSNKRKGRDAGLDIRFGDGIDDWSDLADRGYQVPKLFATKESLDKDFYGFDETHDCEYQGFLYPDEEETSSSKENQGFVECPQCGSMDLEFDNDGDLMCNECGAEVEV